MKETPKVILPSDVAKFEGIKTERSQAEDPNDPAWIRAQYEAAAFTYGCVPTVAPTMDLCT
ncbi:unnamed protein product [Aphanomyces euteiches]